MAWPVLFVAAISIAVAIYNTMNERRREIAILRSLGASQLQICGIIVGEAVLLSLTGGVFGVLACHLAAFLLRARREGLRDFGACMSPHTAWLILQGIIDPAHAKAIVDAWDQCVRGFEADAVTWTESFMIPPELVYAPIARDWVAYNKYDNEGKVICRSKY